MVALSSLWFNSWQLFGFGSYWDKGWPVWCDIDLHVHLLLLWDRVAPRSVKSMTINLSTNCKISVLRDLSLLIILRILATPAQRHVCTDYSPCMSYSSPGTCLYWLHPVYELLQPGDLSLLITPCVWATPAQGPVCTDYSPCMSYSSSGTCLYWLHPVYELLQPGDLSLLITPCVWATPAQGPVCTDYTLCMSYSSSGTCLYWLDPVYELLQPRDLSLVIIQCMSYSSPGTCL